MIKRIVAYGATRNLYEPMMISVHSLLRNNPNIFKVICLIEDDEFPYTNLVQDRRIEFINVKTLKQFVRTDSPNYRSFFTYMSLQRLCFAEWFSYDRMLWIDCDTLIVANIEDLWDMDMTDIASAACEDIIRPLNKDVPYVNTGVVMFNLDYWREHKLTEKATHIVNTQKMNWGDQDALNIVCEGHIKLLPVEYNDFATRSRTFKPKIIHWAGCKEWWRGEVPKSGLWKREMDMIP